MAAEPSTRLLRKLDQDGLDADLDRDAIRVEISTAVKIVLVDNGTPEETLRTKNEVERFAHSGLPDVVPTDQERMSGEINAAFRDASKVRDL